MLVGQTQQINTVVIASGGLSTAYTLRTSNSAVATVNATGLVTATGAGTSTITVIATADTTKRATATITVVAAVNAHKGQSRAASVLPVASIQPDAINSAITIGLPFIGQLQTLYLEPPGEKSTVQGDKGP
jgi:uncharacterized protein YjdB